MARAPRVLTIPPSQPFLETLARAVLSGDVVKGWPDAADPLSLADGTILLPNRRACRVLRDAFLSVGGGAARVLPRIAPIGDVDEDDLAFADPNPLDRLGLDSVPPAIGALDRRLILARLVRAWAASVDRSILKLSPDEPLLVSTSTSDALSLAADLMRLIDQVVTEDVPWSNLSLVVEANLDAYWRMARDFLAIAAETWPSVLEERDEIEPAIRRDLLIKAETERLSGLPGPIIAAGSTGSIRATRDLLRMVAHHPRGALVLPGLDLILDEAGWAAIGDGNGLHGHPQFGLKRLVAHVGLDARDGVEPLAPPASHGREALLSAAMRPAETTEAWANAAWPADDQALDGLIAIEAANEQSEALAVALALRHAVENPNETAALITPDRAFAHRVMAELGRFNVAIDDSGGQPLATTPAGIVARLVARLALEAAAPADILALIVHPALNVGLEPRERGEAIAAIELLALRGLRPPDGLPGLIARFDEAAASIPDRRPDIEPRARLSREAIAAGRALLERLEAALRPLGALEGERPLADLAQTHAAALAALGLRAEAIGAEALLALLAGLGEGEAAHFTVAPADYPGVLDQFLATETIRQPGEPGARVRILGLPEARFVAADTVVLAGLVEGVWPRETALDPWMNRAMRQAFGIEPPERRIGLAAHDFTQALGQRRVVLSRPAKKGGVPTVPSRWLKRLQAVVGAAGWARIAGAGAVYVELAESLDRPAGRHQPAPRPAPVVAPALQSTRFSFSAIATLRRDPYAIYAEHVLRLKPLDALDEEPGAAERGTLIHEALATYMREVIASGVPADPYAALLAHGRTAFEPFWYDAAVRAVWWPRFQRIAEWFVAEEKSRSALIDRSLVEIRGEITWATAQGRIVGLHGRADRIDLLRDGTLTLIDYKTGAPPGHKEVQVGLAPQLTLEAAVATAGGFADIPEGTPVSALLYGRLSGVDPAGEYRLVKLENATPGEVADLHLSELKKLIDEHEAGRPFLSWAMPQTRSDWAGPYDLLARVGEWSQDGGGP